MTAEETKALEIFAAAFSGIRDPRSEAYKDGVKSALVNAANVDVISHTSIRCRYAQGTAECDAWLSGYSEGRILWRMNKI